MKPGHQDEGDVAESELLVQAWQARTRLYEKLFGKHKYSLPKRYQAPRVVAPSMQRALAMRSAIDGAVAAEQEEDKPDVPGLADTADVSSAPGASVSSWRSSIADALSGVMAFDPRQAGQRVSVLVYPPAEGRGYWLYVTSGLSNPWFAQEPDVVSGFGVELVVKTEKEARWPLRLLRRLSCHILSYTGTLSPGIMLSMDSPINAASAGPELSNILVWYVDEAPEAWYLLPSGGFGLFSVIGITEAECRYGESASQYGAWCVQQVLRAAGVGQLTNPGRACVVSRPDIDELLNEVRTYAENFREPDTSV